MNIKRDYPFLYYSFQSLVRVLYKFRIRSYPIKMKMKRDAKLYYRNMHEKLNWNSLQTYNEKMQWEKMFNKDPRKVKLADKYRVREWVKDKIGEQYLIPLLGVWDSSREIDFSKLPNSFVLKTNCGTGDVVIVKDKAKLTAKEIRGIRYKLNYFLHYDCGCNSFEMHYSRMKPKIICEELLEFPDTDVPDYKFLCFDGEPYFCWVDVGRYHNHKRNVYDLDWNLQDWNQKAYGNSDTEIDKPVNFDEMVNIARVLSKGFAHVRVDLYNINGKIYFGELTFTNGSGFEKISPREANLMLGELWKIDVSNIPK